METSASAGLAGRFPAGLWLSQGTVALALGGFLLSGIASLPADEWVPPPRGIDRYEHIWKTSPFVAVAEVNPQAESLASRYAVTGFARVGASEVVFLLDRKGLVRFSLSKDQPKNGVELVSLQNSGDLKTLGATIRSGGEVGHCLRCESPRCQRASARAEPGGWRQAGPGGEKFRPAGSPRLRGGAEAHPDHQTQTDYVAVIPRSARKA